WLCGSGEVQTRQSQPTMGTPTEVPVPRKVKVRAAMSFGGIGLILWGETIVRNQSSGSCPKRGQDPSNSRVLSPFRTTRLLAESGHWTVDTSLAVAYPCQIGEFASFKSIRPTG